MKKVLILAPHPDDEALGCAGTVALLNGKGVSSTVVFLTDGERLNGPPSAEVADRRREEGRRASALFGCREPIFLGLPDGEVGSLLEEGCGKLSDIIALHKPDIVLSPSPIDYHADHIATCRMALNLLNSLHSFTLAFYEVYSTLRFNCLVDITEVVEKKRQMILNYRISLCEKPEVYVKASLGLNAHRSIFVQRGGFYEAFYLVERGDDMEKICDYLSYRDLNR